MVWAGMLVLVVKSLFECATRWRSKNLDQSPSPEPGDQCAGGLAYPGLADLGGYPV